MLGGGSPAALGQRENDIITMMAKTLAQSWHLHSGRLSPRSVALPGAKQPDSFYLPAPLVGHVIRTLRDRRPIDFTPVHVVARDVRRASPSASNDVQFTLWLPKLAKCADAERPIWAPISPGELNDTNVDLLAARYIAAFMIGVAVTYAPRELSLDYLSAIARANWNSLIQAAFDQNGGPLIVAYIEQVRARRATASAAGCADSRALEAHARPAETIEQLWCRDPSTKPVRVMGIDIGGTAVKYTIYEVSRPRDGAPRATFLEKDRGTEPFAAKESYYLQEGRESEVLLGFLKKKTRQDLSRQDAIGISFAAPVMDDVAVGRSGVSRRFTKPDEKHEGTVLEVHERELHRIDFAGAVMRLGARGGRDASCGGVVAVVLNDGDADIRSTPAGAGGQVGLVVTVKEGTGVAFAVRADGAPVDVLAETAKSILNINAGVQKEDKGDEGKVDKDVARRFPYEEFSRRCSRTKFETLLERFAPDFWVALNIVVKGPGIDARDAAGWLIGAILDSALSRPASVGLVEYLRSDRGRWARLTKKVGPPSEMVRLIEIIDSQPSLEVGGDEALYRSAMDELTSRVRMSLSEALAAPGSLRFETQPLRTPVKDYKDLEHAERFVIGLAGVLGGWLADAIAQVCELYAPNEVHLAGGPLSGVTGIFVAGAAARALSEVYAFDVELRSPAAPGAVRGNVLSARSVAHGPREIRKLVLVCPPEDPGEGGPKGAALAAFERYLQHERARQLQLCRSVVAVREESALRDAFSAAGIMKLALKGVHPRLVTEEDVAEMLGLESAALGLTRQPDGHFKVIGSAKARAAGQA